MYTDVILLARGASIEEAQELVEDFLVPTVHSAWDYCEILKSQKLENCEEEVKAYCDKDMEKRAELVFGKLLEWHINIHYFAIKTSGEYYARMYANMLGKKFSDLTSVFDIMAWRGEEVPEDTKDYWAFTVKLHW